MSEPNEQKTGWRSTFCDRETLLISCEGKRGDDPGWGNEPYCFRPGWAVCWADGRGREYLAPMRFGRKQDADRAAETVNRLFAWDTTWKGIVAQINEYGRRNFREALVSELAW